MDYTFNENKFNESFNVKSIEEKSIDSLRLSHIPDNSFKLYPYKASGKTQAPIVTELEECISGFFRRALGVGTVRIDYSDLCDSLLENLEIEPSDIELFKDLVKDLFFEGEDFKATTLGLYPYQREMNNKSADRLAFFLFCVLGIDQKDCEIIKKAVSQYPYNVLEQMVVDAINATVSDQEKNEKNYYPIITDVQEKFKKDFYFMLQTDMTSIEDFSNLLSLYYFYYVSQASITLDQFCQGKRNEPVSIYYALDWEKVSKNRKCCSEGWEALQTNLNHMFCHAITLEIINQHADPNTMYDYIALQEYINLHPEMDEAISKEIEKAERTYTSAIGDYKKFDQIGYTLGGSKTDSAIRHLFRCVEEQFLNTDRKRANQSYNEKFSEFCKVRWIKNRRKSGLVLNLTERDIIFLTKISLRDKDKIRLNDLYEDYMYRGIFLDNISKEHLQEFFTKLNLIDKKSDSGDAQYVKRIL